MSPKTCRQPRACTPRGAGCGISGGRWLAKHARDASAAGVRRRPCDAAFPSCDDPGPPPVEGQRPCARLAGADMDTLDGPATGHAPASDARGHDADATTWITKEAGNRRIPYDRARLERAIDRVHAEFPQLDIVDYKASVFGFVERKQAVNADDLVDHLIREAEARVDVAAPEWEMFAARIYLHRLYKRASRNRFYDVGEKYGSYVGLQESLADRTVYSNDILRAYSKEELVEAGKMIEPARDLLFNYNGLYLLATRYLATDVSREVYELPQERWLTIALYLMQGELTPGKGGRERRLRLVGEAYWAL